MEKTGNFIFMLRRSRSRQTAVSCFRRCCCNFFRANLKMFSFYNFTIFYTKVDVVGIGSEKRREKMQCCIASIKTHSKFLLVLFSRFLFFAFFSSTDFESVYFRKYLYNFSLIFFITVSFVFGGFSWGKKKKLCINIHL